MARILDQYYIATRYPDGRPSGHAGLYYTAEQARDALDKSRQFLELAKNEIGT